MEKGFEVGTPRTFRTRNWALGSGVSGLCTGGTRVYGELQRGRVARVQGRMKNYG